MVTGAAHLRVSQMGSGWAQRSHSNGTHLFGSPVHPQTRPGGLLDLVKSKLGKVSSQTAPAQCHLALRGSLYLSTTMFHRDVCFSGCL